LDHSHPGRSVEQRAYIHAIRRKEGDRVSEERKRQQLDRHPERGGVLVTVAIVLPVIFIMAAVVIDLGHLFKVRTQLQGTADASALAAAAQLASSPTQAVPQALLYAGRNYAGYGEVVKAEDVVTGRWSGTAFTPGGTPANAVRVTARRGTANGNQVPLFLGGFVGQSFSSVSASAVAVAQGATAGACIYVLHENQSGALFIGSGTIVNTCDVRVHSNRGSTCPTTEDQEQALRVESNSRLFAQGYTIEQRGGCFRTNDSQWNPIPTRGGDVPDPLAGVPAPVVPNRCDRTGSPSKIETTGTYPATANADGFYVWCGGLHVAMGSATQTATLRPGIHVMRGGGLKMDKGILNATDVMIYNTCNNTAASCASNQSTAERIEVVGVETRYNQTAPSAGIHKGLLFFQDRLMSNTHENTFGSQARLDLDGVMYFPTQLLIIGSGTGIAQGNRITFVTNRLRIASGTELWFKDLPTRLPSALEGGNQLSLVQ
jgi:Flp pilus assembly protein TadG